MPDMRFAPPNPLRIADRASGMNALSVRSYNERLVLSLLLQNEGISRMDVGQRTGLSAQTVSVIVRSLEQEGLVALGDVMRGRVGPPTVRLALNPEGAFAVGIGLGYRLVEVVLIDFVGTVRFYRKLPIEAVDAVAGATSLLSAVREAIDSLPGELQGRVAGIGLAVPDDIDAWRAKRTGDAGLNGLRGILESVGLPVFVQNDITATAGGESLFGAAKSLDDYLFFYLGARLHTRLVLRHQIYQGTSSTNRVVGLLRLEQMLAEQGLVSSSLWERGQWPDFGPVMDQWQAECLASLVGSTHALGQFVDLKTVVLSSYAPSAVSKALCDRLAAAVPAMRFMQSSIGTSPKAVGAAGVPLSSRLMVQ